MRIGILGRSQLLYESIRPLQDADHEIAFILTCPEAPEYTRTAADFESLAHELTIPFRNDDRINTTEMQAWIKSHMAQVGFSINWRTLIGPDVLSAFPEGIVNVHAGDLPRFRGNATPNWAILNGEPEIFLTAHLMAEDLDSGPILAKRRIAIDEHTYIGDLYKAFVEETPQLLVEVADGLRADSLTPEPQSTALQDSLRCYPRLPRDSEIDWAQSAVEIGRLVRASAEPFGGAYTWFNGDRLTIWRAHPADTSAPYLGCPGQVAELNRASGAVTVITGHGLLELQEAQLPGKDRDKASRVIRSARARLGLDYTAEIERLRQQIKELKHRG